MEKEQEYKTGDIFAVEIAKNEYAFGRLLFDTKAQIAKGLIDWTSGLALTEKDTILVEFFKQTSNEKKFDKTQPEVIIPGIFTLNLDLLDFTWEVIDFIEVDPTTLDFPEFLSWDGAFNGKFSKGEISHQIEISGEEVEAININPSIKALVTIPEYILHALGRIEEIRENRRLLRDLKNIDLRFSEHGSRIREMLPEEFKKPYYEVAKAKGFDLARFYE